MARVQSVLWNPGFTGTFEFPVLVPSDGFDGKWEERNWRNVPGPFYGAETDTCGTGWMCAPSNVFEDPDLQEYVCIQPRTWSEFEEVVTAAGYDPFVGYGLDGNLQWTRAGVETWWCRRPELLAELQKKLQEHQNQAAPDPSYVGSINAFLAYLEREVEPYLAHYIFWLEHRRQPKSGEKLPTLVGD